MGTKPMRGFWGGLLVGLALTAAAREAPYINWRAVAAPIDGPQLLGRQIREGIGESV